MSINQGDNYLKRAAELNALAPMFKREGCPPGGPHRYKNPLQCECKSGAGRVEIDVVKLEQYRALDREATVLLNALYDAIPATDPDEIQAWFDQRVDGTDARYPGMIGRLRAALRELHS